MPKHIRNLILTDDEIALVRDGLFAMAVLYTGIPIEGHKDPAESTKVRDLIIRVIKLEKSED